jgi:uncharacterized protein (TIGR00369 family)
MRLYSQSRLPSTPFARLVGFGIGHVGAGSLTGRMKASDHLAFPPALNLSPLGGLALYACGAAAIEAGFDLEPVTTSLQYFRPPRAQPGNFLGRARVLNASSVFVSCSAELEDPVGRLVGYATSQWAVRTVDPPPPAAPASIEVAEDAAYATPDPPDRPPAGTLPPPDVAARHTGLEIVRMVMSGELPPIPMMHTLGVRWVNADEGSCDFAMPASEWFCNASRNLDPGAVTSLLSIATAGAAVTMWAPGQSLAALDGSTRFLHPVKADGRELSARARITHRSGNLVVVEGEALDADGSVFAINSGVIALLDPRDRRTTEPERVLTTLLFTDIVGSTQHAERLGDAVWRSLLEKHHALVREELGAQHGREVNTTGDGFLARFDSPAGAVRCAKAIRNRVKGLNLSIRSGVHTGECEVQGTDLAGIAVHVAARVTALADADEILVSGTVRDLAAGSGLRFTPRGAHQLKGVEGEWNLFAVED